MIAESVSQEEISRLIFSMISGTTILLVVSAIIISIIIIKLAVKHVLLKPSLKDFEHYFSSM